MTSHVSLDEIESILWPHIRDAREMDRILGVIARYGWQNKTPAPVRRKERTCKQCSNPVQAGEYCGNQCFRVWFFDHHPDYKPLPPEPRNTNPMQSPGYV